MTDLEQQGQFVGCSDHNARLNVAYRWRTYFILNILRRANEFAWLIPDFAAVDRAFDKGIPPGPALWRGMVLTELGKVRDDADVLGYALYICRVAPSMKRVRVEPSMKRGDRTGQRSVSVAAQMIWGLREARRAPS